MTAHEPPICYIPNCPVCIAFGHLKLKPVCPECEQNKHGNCDGTALDPATDEIVDCGCVHR